MIQTIINFVKILAKINVEYLNLNDLEKIFNTIFTSHALKDNSLTRNYMKMRGTCPFWGGKHEDMIIFRQQALNQGRFESDKGGWKAERAQELSLGGRLRGLPDRARP